MTRALSFRSSPWQSEGRNTAANEQITVYYIVHSLGQSSDLCRTVIGLCKEAIIHCLRTWLVKCRHQCEVNFLLVRSILVPTFGSENVGRPRPIPEKQDRYNSVRFQPTTVTAGTILGLRINTVSFGTVCNCSMGEQCHMRKTVPHVRLHAVLNLIVFKMTPHDMLTETTETTIPDNDLHHFWLVSVFEQNQQTRKLI